jgi:hypothetical protein
MLDLHDVGAEAREQLGREGHGRHLFECEDAHTVERLAVLLRVRVGDVSDAHGGIVEARAESGQISRAT